MAGGFDQWFISTGCVVQVSMSGGRAVDVSSPVGPLDVLRPDAVVGVWLLFLFLIRQRRRKDDVVLDRLPSPSSSVDISFLSSFLTEFSSFVRKLGSGSLLPQLQHVNIHLV
ncbi:hypothetical protein VPH35_053404 [Triticum aestivum]